MHEKPAVVAEWVTIRLLNRAADCRSDMCEEIRRADVIGELLQVFVVPSWLGAVKDARGWRRAIPADAEAIAVRGLGAEPRMPALFDQRIGWPVQRFLE
jgi:hypothetical protein